MTADMAVIRQIEACYRRIFGGSAYAAAVPESERKIVPRAEARKTMPLPVSSEQREVSSGRARITTAM